MVWCRPELLAVLVAASSVVPGASGCAGQSSAGSASPHWLVPPVLPPGAFTWERPGVRMVSSRIMGWEC